MKKMFFLVIVFSVFALGNAQEQDQQFMGTIYEFSDVDAQAYYSEGAKGFNKLLANNFKPPQVDGVGGKMLTSFVIEVNGTISNIVVSKHVGYGSDKEMIRVLKKSGLWIPSEKDGKKVRSRFEFPMMIQSSGY